MSEKNVRPACGDCTSLDPERLLGAYAAAEDGIGRRTFLVQSGILAAIAALSACSVTDSTAPNVPANSQINVADYPALATVGGVAVVSLGGAPVAIVRTSSTTFLALSRVCPHQGGIVQQSGTRFICPVHGATFDLNGSWVGGQRTSSLHQYSTSYDATTNTLSVS
ncbi:MAG TPA: Rieske (2Fe-2S) protein [Gemmatimonadaceae bacterium]|jgi:Rieske Fe-S protein|nr:Rieske (2Fe-2S) protein [Gemmatimonadaceae bacterium]